MFFFIFFSLCVPLTLSLSGFVCCNRCRSKKASLEKKMGKKKQKFEEKAQIRRTHMLTVTLTRTSQLFHGQGFS
jgi:hypothetical protein